MSPIWPPTATEIELKRQQADLAIKQKMEKILYPALNPLAESVINAVGSVAAKPGDVWLDPMTDSFIYMDVDGSRRRIAKEDMMSVNRPTRDPARWTPYEKLKMRVNIGPGEEIGCHCNIFIGPNATFVFVASGDKALILEDVNDLFPSDALVAQFQLWKGSL